jgi:small-conductance mechanosensitive channel
VDLFGVRLVGVNPESGRKLLLTLLFVAIFLVVRIGARAAARAFRRGGAGERARFWSRQGLNLVTTGFLVLGVLSIWFNDPQYLAAAAGLLTVGLAFSLQRVVTSLAGYFAILWGTNFAAGDRIEIGGVRGDVIGIGFLQTTVMEMGQPALGANPEMWVRSLQYTGRVVAVSNARVFDEPVYNYTRDFPYLWDEISVGIPYRADRALAEQILLEVASTQTLQLSDMSREALRAMRRRYFVQTEDLRPKVYFRITDNWLELTIRFVVEVRGIRDFKDAMTREVLRRFDEVGIPIASATSEITTLSAAPSPPPGG